MFIFQQLDFHKMVQNCSPYTWSILSSSMISVAWFSTSFHCFFFLHHPFNTLEQNLSRLTAGLGNSSNWLFIISLQYCSISDSVKVLSSRRSNNRWWIPISRQRLRGRVCQPFILLINFLDFDPRFNSDACNVCSTWSQA